MDREYYYCWVRLDHQDNYLIWYSSNSMGVLTDVNRNAVRFATMAELALFAQQHRLSLQDEESILHDLDVVNIEVTGTIATSSACNILLAAWNILDDIAHSCHLRFDSNRRLTKRIYMKLVFGCNLPALTPFNHAYLPTRTNAQRKIIRKTLRRGMRMFRTAVRQPVK